MPPPTAAGRLTRLTSPVLAARENELELLTRTVTHPPAVAVLEGEAGVGKTRLVNEMAARVAGMSRVLLGHCHPLDEPFPLGPVVEAVRAVGSDLAGLALSPLAGALRPVLPDVAGLPARPEPLGDPGMERHRLWRALSEVLGALSPAVLVVEDLHWSDHATLQFLTFLLASPPPALAVVLTSRLESVITPSPVRGLVARLPAQMATARIQLPPLSAADVQAMVGAILETDQVSEEFASYLHERTAGLPLAVEEVLRLLVDRRDIVRWRGRWARRALDEVHVPDAVRDSFLRRLATVGPEARRVVEAAAVLGWPATEAVLGMIVELDEQACQQAVSAAVASGLLHASGAGYTCRHALAAEAVHDAIPVPERQRRHERVARAMEAAAEAHPASDLPARLAHHWRESGQVERWVHWAVRAAELAVSLGDPGTATNLLLDAASAPGVDGPAAARLGLLLSEAAADSLAQAEAIDALRRVLERPDLPPQARGELLANLGALLHQAGRAWESHVALEEAVPDLADRPVLAAHVMTALALPWVAGHTVDEHLAWLGRADALVGPGAPGDPIDVRRGDRAAVLLALGDPAGWDAVPHPPAADDDLLVRREWVRLCTNLAVNAFYLGHDHRAAGFVEDGRRVAADAGYERMAAALGTATVLLRWSGGDWDGLAAAAAELRDAHPDVPSYVQATMVLGHLCLARGQLTEAEARSAEAVQRAEACGALPVVAASAAVLARARLARGDTAAAASVVGGAIEVVAAKDIWFWATAAMPSLVAALLAGGRTDEATGWVRRFAAGIQGRDAPAAGAALAACRGLLAEAGGAPGTAARHFTRSAGAWARLGRPYDAVLATEGSARCLFAAGEEKRAATSATAALSELRRLGAEWDEARVRRLLRQHGVAVPYPRRGSEGYGEQLSPREQEVVELAASGLTSVRIGRRLFLSPRTVDHHLERALRKLGMSSRKELVARHDLGTGSTLE